MDGKEEPSVEDLFGDKREFSVVEENAIYHAAGYVIRKLIKKFRRSGGKNAYMHNAILLHMIGEGAVGDVPDSADSFLDYVKVWTNNSCFKRCIQIFCCFGNCFLPASEEW